jgi:hypothetical protein
MRQFEHFVEGHWFKCIVCMNVGMYLLWLASTQRGRVYQAWWWLVRFRTGNMSGMTDELRAKIARRSLTFLAVVSFGIGIYDGAFGVGLLKDKPPPAQWQVDAAKKRFEEARKQRREAAQVQENVNPPAANPDAEP